MRQGTSQIAIRIRSRQKQGRLDKKRLWSVAAFVLQNEWQIWLASHKRKAPDASLEFAVHFIEEKEMVRRHKESHGLAQPTDVICYDYVEGVFQASGEWMLAEVFVSVSEALLAAGRLGTQVDYELTLYLVHGILHCFGYDDTYEECRSLMRQRESFYMNLLQWVGPVLIRPGSKIE